MKRIFSIVLVSVLALSARAIELSSTPATDEDWTAFLDVIANVESGGNETVSITDVNGKKSVGCLQIQQSYLTDSRLNYTLEDMKDKTKAYAVAKAYLQRYGAAYTRRTGKPATFEVLARIHNGGPKGAERAATLPYIEKVKGKIGV